MKDPEFAEVSWIFDLIGSFIWGIALLYLLPKLAVGIGLTQGKSWANVPGLVFGVISLINFPIGTLVGVMPSWSLLPNLKSNSLLSRHIDDLFGFEILP